MFINVTDSPFPLPSGRIVKPTQICPWFSLSFLPEFKALNFLPHAFLCLPWLSLGDPAGEEG